jgi:hypothetical protein
VLGKEDDEDEIMKAFEEIELKSKLESAKK